MGRAATEQSAILVAAGMPIRDPITLRVAGVVTRPADLTLIEIGYSTIPPSVYRAKIMRQQQDMRPVAQGRFYRLPLCHAALSVTGRVMNWATGCRLSAWRRARRTWATLIAVGRFVSGSPLRFLAVVVAGVLRQHTPASLLPSKARECRRWSDAASCC